MKLVEDFKTTESSIIRFIQQIVLVMNIPIVVNIALLTELIPFWGLNR